MSSYQIIDRAPGTLVTTHPDFGRQVWTLARMTYKHRHDACAICASMVGSRAYRPITNRRNRTIRICERHGNEPNTRL